MKTYMISAGLWKVSILFGCALTVMGAEDDPNRFGLSLRLGFNAEAKFKDHGGLTSLAQPGPATGGGLDRTYDDGFVRRDASGNQQGLTWNWGYEHAAQIVNDTLQLHSSSASPGAAFRQDNDPQPGVEVSYGRRLGEFSWGKWGLEAAFNVTEIEIRDSRTRQGNGNVLTDSYALGGIVPPLPPYAGSFAGPGPVIGDTPVRSFQAVVGSVNRETKQQIEGQLYGSRLGPYLEIPLPKRLAIEFGAGLALAVVDSEFRYSDQVTLAGTTTAHRGRNNASDLLAGAYGQAQLTWRVSRRVSLATGAQFQYLPDFEQRIADKEAQLELGQSVFFTLGVRVHF